MLAYVLAGPVASFTGPDNRLYPDNCESPDTCEAPDICESKAERSGSRFDLVPGKTVPPPS